jgi:hypothetical protein
MSYSFGAVGASASEVETKVRDELVQVVKHQHAHKADVDQAFDATSSLLKLLRTPLPTEKICASVCGSVWVSDDGNVNSASLSINVGFTTTS